MAKSKYNLLQNLINLKFEEKETLRQENVKTDLCLILR